MTGSNCVFAVEHGDTNMCAELAFNTNTNAPVTCFDLPGVGYSDAGIVVELC